MVKRPASSKTNQFVGVNEPAMGYRQVKDDASGPVWSLSTGRPRRRETARDEVSTHSFMRDEFQFTLLRGKFALALAVEAPPGVEAARAAVRAVVELRAEKRAGRREMIGVAFSGQKVASVEVVDEFKGASVYVATKRLTGSAIRNAQAFLEEVSRAAPQAAAIAGISAATG